MQFYYSPSARGFFEKSLHGSTMPLDCRSVEHATYLSLLEEQSRGKMIVADANGCPVAIDRPTPSAIQLLESIKAQMRQQRMPMLDALAGIAGRAQRGGDAALAAAADALAVALLDITDDPALNTATTLEDMQAAGIAAYRAIAATASPALASVFKEITGA